MTKLRLLSSHVESGNVKTFVFETGGPTWIAFDAKKTLQCGNEA
jgi:hypothetical protein